MNCLRDSYYPPFSEVGRFLKTSDTDQLVPNVPRQRAGHEVWQFREG